ncbi:hypothetical protein [Gordonia sp. (in: high G+C Gram-positive bacteria)]|uniref:hypothetical protein n=1 Tax=unclassified Gordonia (in: high G+C Gram-positive bacteria) TaxID=2657482 RepID=UPI00260941C7|nr:hypothetical protein [Gordonia sp. (in: high G+C Gram-positive bacteria)]
MADDTQETGTGATSGDPVGTLLLGVAGQIEQLAALITGPGLAGLPGIDDEGLARLAGLVGEAGGLAAELGDLVSRLLAACIAVLEAAAELLRAESDTAAPASTRFQSIPVRITAAPAHP